MQQTRALNSCLYKIELLVLLEELRRRDIATIMATEKWWQDPSIRNGNDNGNHLR